MRAARLRGAYTNRQTRIKFSEFQDPRMSCPCVLCPSISSPPLFWFQNWPSMLAWLHWSSYNPHIREILTLLISLWVAFRWSTGVVTVTCASPGSRGWPCLQAGCLSSASPLLTVLYLGKQERARCRVGSIRRCAGVYSQNEFKEVQQGRLHYPDITELSLTHSGFLCLSAYLPLFRYTTNQQAHTMQAAVHWLQSSGSHHKGVVYVCVCLSLSLYVGKCVSLCVCRWEQGLGNWEWEPPDCNSGCYLGNPGGKYVLNEWVGDGSTLDAYVWGMWLRLWI